MDETRDFKQVIIVNDALGLPRGKLAAQVAHAAVGALLHAPAESQQQWLAAGMPKVVLQCDSEEQLVALEQEAIQACLPCMLVRDAGRTVLAAGTITCLGIGPAHRKDIDRLTGALKLVR